MKYYGAFDVGGTSIKYAVVSKEGNIVLQGKVKTPDTLEVFYETIATTFKELEKDHSLEGLAFSLPGAVDSESGVIGGSSALDYIHGPNIKKDIEARIQKPVEMENDANCAALAEVWLGSGSDVKDCMFIVSGTGIGGAIVKDKRIHKGIHLHGGEFGYMISTNNIEENEFSTWSFDGSTVAVVKGVAKELGVDPSSLDGKEIFDHADEDPVYQKYVNRFYYVLAMGIYNLQYVFDPEKIIIGGAVSQREELIAEVNKRLDVIFSKLTHAKIRPVVVKCKFQNDANLIGATYHFINH